jgi:Holliday junction DNA helicase RuvA
MIASLFGTVRSLRQDQLIIDVNGVGYLVQINLKTANDLAVGRDIQIYTSMVVRDDAMLLYGFLSEADRELFGLIQTVSGFGPKVAMAVTQAMSIEDLASAIHTKDEQAIAAIPGIGKKSAQRLILELSGKLEITKSVKNNLAGSWRDELLDALLGLGFSRRQAESALNQLSANRELGELNSMSASDRLKLALSFANSIKGLSK